VSCGLDSMILLGRAYDLSSGRLVPLAVSGAERAALFRGAASSGDNRPRERNMSGGILNPVVHAGMRHG